MGYNAAIHMDWGVFFVLEASSAPIRPLLPPGIHLVEPSPGRTLLALNLVHFLQGGDQVDLPENFEIDIGVNVPVDNSAYAGDLPQASTAVHVLNIASTSRDYLEFCRDSGYRIDDGEGLSFDLSPDGFEGTISDARGALLSFAARTPDLAFAPFRRLGQDVVYDHRGTYRLNYVFEGEGLAAPSADCFALTLHQHPFFLGLDLDGDKPRQHEPFALKTGLQATTSFYGPDEETV